MQVMTLLSKIKVLSQYAIAIHSDNVAQGR
jgi:hypothetical protein